MEDRVQCRVHLAVAHAVLLRSRRADRLPRGRVPHLRGAGEPVKRRLPAARVECSLCGVCRSCGHLGTSPHRRAAHGSWTRRNAMGAPFTSDNWSCGPGGNLYSMEAALCPGALGCRGPSLPHPLGWGLAQYPYLFSPTLTIADAAAPNVTLTLIVWTLTGGALLLFPSLIYLVRIFKRQR